MGDESRETSGWLENLTEGGLPQLVAGPAGKAISRLIGAGVEIPAAWLEQKAQAIRDETRAKSMVMEALAGKSAEAGIADPKLLDRGLHSLLGRAYREQENREAVAQKTIEELQDDPPRTDREGPSDDWMNSFEAYAARASSEELRGLFARVLAGEIRKPGQFSLATMQLVSILDSTLAALIETAAPFVWDGSAVAREAIDQIVQYRDLMQLEEIGFMSLGSGMVSLTKTASRTGHIGFRSQEIGIIGEFEPGSEVKLSTYVVSRAGRELLAVLNVNPDVGAMARALRKSGAKRVLYGPAITNGDGFSIPHSIEVPE